MEAVAAYSRYYPGTGYRYLEETKKTSVKASIVPVKIRTHHIPEISLQGYT
jgi:hypothetical protein